MDEIYLEELEQRIETCDKISHFLLVTAIVVAIIGTIYLIVRLIMFIKGAVSDYLYISRLYHCARYKKLLEDVKLAKERQDEEFCELWELTEVKDPFTADE